MNTNGNDVPPPLPTTAHPQLSRSVSQQQQKSTNGSNYKNNTNNLTKSNNSKADVLKYLTGKFKDKEPNESMKTTKENANTKYLNRSFSDAAYGRNQLINGNITEMNAILSKYRPKMLMSGEKETMHDDQMQFSINDEEYIEVSYPNSADNSSIKRTGSCSSSGTELFSIVSNDTSPSSNRSLPTMGISMLGKKRLSNVSADCSAIEKAIAIHNRGQSSPQHQGQQATFEH